MKLTRSFLAIALSFSLVFVSSLTLAVPSVSAQDSKIALQRGYRTGYSDGYMSGYRDAIENAAKSYERHNEYKSADRAYIKDYGKEADYKDGYKQGFENGYDTGFEKRSFDATIPTELKFRGAIKTKTPAETAEKKVKTAKEKAISPIEKNVAKKVDKTTTEKSIDTPAGQMPDSAIAINTDGTSDSDDGITNRTGDLKPPVIKTKTDTKRSAVSGDEIIIIPANTELLIELVDEIDTARVREGDAFSAKIVSPVEISGAIIEGRIAKNRRPGRLKRRAELILSFDRIKISETRWSNFNAIIMEVLPIKGDNVKRVDVEGEVEGQRPYKGDMTKVGASTGAGLFIGAIVGGPVGAAVGAGVGAAFGVGAAVVERGKYIKLFKDQQLRIKTAYETQIR